jgi:hypothetical protein
MMLALVTLCGLAAAPPAHLIQVQVDPSLEAVAPAPAVRDAVGRELGLAVVEPGSTEATIGRLEVRRLEGGRVALLWRDASGHDAWREVELPEDGTAPAVIALHAGTLARNEVDELIADRAAEGTVGAAEVREQAAAPAEASADRRFVLGVDVWGASVSGSATSAAVEPYGFVGVELGYRLFPWLKVGLCDTLLATANGRWQLSTAPFGEVSTRWSRLEPYARIGALSQVRFGAGLPPAGGFAPFVGAGARVWVSQRVALGLGARLMVATTDYVQLISQLLPQGAVTLAGVLDVGVSL